MAKSFNFDAELFNTSVPGTSSNEDQYGSIFLDRIEINPANDYSTNDSNEELETLADDIERNSLLHNIVVMEKEPGRYIILSGERRFKAYKILRERHKDDRPNKYDEIYCRIYKNLDETEQMLIIDAANLQARGASASDEISMRKGMLRFVENLKKKYGLSDREAIMFMRKQANVSKVVSWRNIKIERELSPELKDYLDNGLIKKDDALILAELSDEMQKTVIEAFEKARTNGEFDEVSEKIVDVSKGVVEIENKIDETDKKIEKSEDPSEKKTLRRTKEKSLKEKDERKQIISSLADNINDMPSNDMTSENDSESEDVDSLKVAKGSKFSATYSKLTEMVIASQALLNDIRREDVELFTQEEKDEALGAINKISRKIQKLKIIIRNNSTEETN